MTDQLIVKAEMVSKDYLVRRGLFAKAQTLHAAIAKGERVAEYRAYVLALSTTIDVSAEPRPALHLVPGDSDRVPDDHDHDHDHDH